MLYVVIATGVLFTVWTAFGQRHSLTHGVAVLRGRYDSAQGPGAIRHAQALSAALSATVGIGNIGGVALAISLGGPGAVFWMWVIGVFGMALKTAEVSLSMLYRDTRDPDNPHGGPMFVAARAFAERGWPRLGRAVGGVFVVTLLVSSITGGNMFQAWNVADVTHHSFGVPKLVVGGVLALLVGLVILGGIQRIGKVAGRLVPLMCTLYLAAALFVVLRHLDRVPEVLRSIVGEAFTPTACQGAFLGGTAGYALLWGIKRALFSSEAGQGSSPIAHCAARTPEPIREGVVAGLEPFIDTLVVCTLTALVLLLTGVWNRPADARFAGEPVWQRSGTSWTAVIPLTGAHDLADGDEVFTLVRGGPNEDTGLPFHRVAGRVSPQESGLAVKLDPWTSPVPPEWTGEGAWRNAQGASLTALAFDATVGGLGRWLVTIAAWLFAVSTMISWSYYGEQGIVYLLGSRAVPAYKVVYCLLILVATVPALMRTDQQLDDVTSLGTGVMLWANLPILLLFGGRAMRAYRDYVARWRAGEFEPEA